MDKKQIADPQVLKEREDRHRRLMKMIKNYKRTEEQLKKLERIKNNTTMEINLRFLKSEHNRYYRFPKLDTDTSQEEQNLSPLGKKQQIIYDLKIQNEINQKHKKNLVSLEGSRRIKSLERQKPDLQEQRLGRLHEVKQRQLSYKRLRKNSLTTKKKVNSHIKLPELKNIEKLKTETKNDSGEINKVIKKKLITQISTTQTHQGLEKLIKNHHKNKKVKFMLQKID